MKRTIFLIWWFIFGIGAAFSAENQLLSVKPMALPDNRIRLDFHFSKPLEKMPASFMTEKPARLVLDFAGVDSKIPQPNSLQVVNLAALTQYRIVGATNRVRAVLDLPGLVYYSGNCVGNHYNLILSGKTDQMVEPTKEIVVTKRPVNAHFHIKHVDFRGTDKQGGRIVVDVSKPGVPVDVKQIGRNLTVNFLNTSVPAALMKRYDVSDFHTPATYFTLKQVGNGVQLVAHVKGDYAHFTYQVNNQVMLDVFPLSAEEVKQAKLKKRIFTGKRISLNFQKIQVRAVLQLLADFTGLNLVVSANVTGDITLRLNDIPWDQALDIILTTQGLDKRQTGNVMLIDKATDIAARELNELKTQEETRKKEPVRSDLLQINYAKATDIATMLKDKSNSLLSDRGNLSVDVRTNSIWIQDVGSRIEEIRDLVKQLDIPVKQVLIESRIVTVDKNFEQDLGIQFGISKPTHLSGTLSGANELAKGVPPAFVDPFRQRLNVDLQALPTLVSSPASIGIALAKLGDGILLDLELSAMESENRGEIIASPRLITSNQQPAIIESGSDIPYQESTSSGATAVAFKKAVLSLSVTPQITPNNKIMMTLKINQDEQSPERVNNVPVINTKQIQTNVLVNNGQTIVLGGIYKQNKVNSMSRVPFLGNLPVVGYMFRKTHTDIQNEELLIFITPRIITNTLAVTTVQGHGLKGVELDKFGKPVNYPKDGG